MSFACYATYTYTPIRAVLSYSDCYLTLGATPDTDWETLRANYKRLIGRWHPDRFSGDTVSKRIAEERSKQITLAYQTLEKYRRDHGALPPRKPAVVTAQGPTGSAVPMSERAGSEVRVEPVNTGPAVREFARRRPVRQSRVAIALVFFALIAALYLAQRYEWASDDDRPAGRAHDPGAATPAPRLQVSPRDSHGISTGSTLGDVYAIQGVPSLTQGDTWHYGKSQIRFAQGKVISWKEHPDDPLRTAGDQFAQSHGATFDVGSTKEEVRAIQGTPVRETDTLWDYAPSRVYFRHNRVIRWEESPVQPLRVPR